MYLKSVMTFAGNQIWMDYLYKNSPLEMSEYKYEIDGNKLSANIYKTNNNSKKIILFLSGGCILKFDMYIKKTIIDLQEKYPEISEKYEFILYEKHDKSSVGSIYKDVCMYIKDLYESIKFEELVIIGYSAGGVIASHVMSCLKEYSFKKKIITYDSPFQILDSLRVLGNNLFYRIDYYFSYRLYNAYNKHHNKDIISDKLSKFNKYNRAERCIEFMKNIHNTDTQDIVEYNAGFNFDQTDDTSIINIYCTIDPIVDRESSDNYIKNNSTIEQRSKMKFIRKNITGHCSDMCYNPDYIKDIVRAIKFM
jgi:esterase/lipase